MPAYQKLSVQQLFRQHYRPEPATEFYAPRCWALDFAPAREFLKHLLRMRNPDWDIPIWGRGGVWDPELNLLAVQLGLDQVSAPVNQAKILFHYSAYFTRLLWSSRHRLDKLLLMHVHTQMHTELQSAPLHHDVPPSQFTLTRKRVGARGAV